MATSKENYQVTTTDPQGMQLRMNSIFQSVADRLDKIEGIRGEASIESDLDMNDNTVKNVNITATSITADDLTVTDSLFKGDIFFSGTDSGLVYGCIDVADNAVETTIASQGVAVQVVVWDNNGPSHHTSPDFSNSHIVIDKAGVYLIAVSSTVNSVGGSSSRFEITVKKNNGASVIIPHADRDIAGGGGASGVISMSGIVALAVGDTIELWIENESNTANYIVENSSLTVLQIGGV